MSRKFFPGKLDWAHWKGNSNENENCVSVYSPACCCYYYYYYGIQKGFFFSFFFSEIFTQLFSNTYTCQAKKKKYHKKNIQIVLYILSLLKLYDCLCYWTDFLLITHNLTCGLYSHPEFKNSYTDTTFFEFGWLLLNNDWCTIYVMLSLSSQQEKLSDLLKLINNVLFA